VWRVHEKFFKLDAEKQKVIINAALVEFAEKGYEQASTNQIVKNAGIGKGMLFYYFNSKEDLYLFLINYSFDILLNHYLLLITDEHRDFFDHIRHISKIKMKYFSEFPEVNQFLGRFVLLDGENIPQAVKKKYEEVVATANMKVYGNQNIDHSVFRDDIDPVKAHRMIELFLKGYQADLLEKMKGKSFSQLNLAALWEEFDDYLDTLKTVFYKRLS
jgi:TetR/AcrR family transcriptional regulator